MDLNQASGSTLIPRVSVESILDLSGSRWIYKTIPQVSLEYDAYTEVDLFQASGSTLILRVSLEYDAYTRVDLYQAMVKCLSVGGSTTRYLRYRLNQFYTTVDLCQESGSILIPRVSVGSILE